MFYGLKAKKKKKKKKQVTNEQRVKYKYSKQRCAHVFRWIIAQKLQIYLNIVF